MLKLSVIIKLGFKVMLRLIVIIRVRRLSVILSVSRLRLRMGMRVRWGNR